MTELDKEAFKDWKKHHAFSYRLNNQEITWEAACEYKDKEYFPIAYLKVGDGVYFDVFQLQKERNALSFQNEILRQDNKGAREIIKEVNEAERDDELDLLKISAEQWLKDNPDDRSN